MRFEICLLGRLGYDLYAEQQGLPLKDVASFRRYLGGSTANTAVGLSRLGLEVGVISCLGSDPLSDYLLEYLERESVDVALVQRRDGCLPSLCLTEVSPPDRFPQVFYREKAADTLLEAGPRERRCVAGSQMFVTNGTSLCASPSRESTLRALQWAREAGVRTVLDVDYRWMSWKSPEDAALYARLALPWVDVLIANPEELALVSGRSDAKEAVQRLLRLGVPLIAAKLGDRGTRLVSAGESCFLPPYPVEVASTIGAGDGFAAGFLYGLAREMPLPEALQYGNAAAALVVSRVMCSDAMSRLREVRQLIARHPRVESTA